MISDGNRIPEGFMAATKVMHNIDLLRLIGGMKHDLEYPQIIRRLNQKFYSVQNQYLDDNKSSIVNTPLYNPNNFVRYKQCPLYGNGNMVVLTMDNSANEFATNIPLDLIESIKLEIGGQRINKITPKDFSVLYYIFNIPEKNENGNTILPIPGLIHGIHRLEYHEIKIIFEFKKLPFENILYFIEFKEYS